MRQSDMNLFGLAAAISAPLAAQPPAFELSLIDGSSLVGKGLDWSGDRLRLDTGSGAVEVSIDRVFALHGAAVVAHDLPWIELAGGEVVRGTFVGGDKNGEWCEVQSPVLGRRRIAVDRIASVVFRPAQARSADLRLPAGVVEAMFQKAGIGLDTVPGSVHQFDGRGVLFQRTGEAQPKWFRGDDLIGLRLGSAEPRKARAPAELLTRTGDRIGVEPRGWHAGEFTVQFEDGSTAKLRASDVAALTWPRAGVVCLSSLTPAAVDERGFDGDVILPWQRDASVTGGPLCAGGRSHGRGLGVHSRCRLAYLVPEGTASFCTHVGIDDSALALLPRADVALRIVLDEREVFRAELKAGDPVRTVPPVPVKPGQRLSLEVDFGRGRDLADRVDWLSPVFLAGKAKS